MVTNDAKFMIFEKFLCSYLGHWRGCDATYQSLYHVKKFNVVVRTASTSKYINYIRFYSHRENSAKKWEVVVVVVVEATVVAGVNFIC